MINRSLITAFAKEPFQKWLQTLPEMSDITLEEINHDPTAYLIPEFEDQEQLEEILQEFYDTIFEDQLSEWVTNEADWPQQRDLETFLAWFHLHFHSVVLDLVDDELVEDGS